MINPIEYVRERRTRRRRKRKLWIAAVAVIALTAAVIGAWWAMRNRTQTVDTSGLPGTDHTTSEEPEQAA